MNKKLVFELLKNLKRIRMVEEAIAEKYAEQKMRCPTHLSIGQEAVAVGVCAALSKDDLTISGHRAHAHYLAKGGDLKKLIAELYGKETGCCGGFGGSMHLLDESVGFMGSTAIVAGTVPIALGLAYANKITSSNKVTCAFLGEAVTETGVFFESINLAAVKNLPVIFVCENNLYSVYTDLKPRQSTKRNNKKMVESIGMKYACSEGNDVQKVHKTMQNIVEKVKKTCSPYFVEFSTFRYLEHCGPNNDDHLGYRPKSQVKKWLQLDPVEIFERRVINKLLSKSRYEKIIRSITLEIDDAFQKAELAKFPNHANCRKFVNHE